MYYLKYSMLACCLAMASCGKEFLDVKRDSKQVIPATIQDYQAILDYVSIMTTNTSHELGVIGGDEYYLADNIWNLLRDPYQKNGYIWAADVYENQDIDDWNEAYFRILYANMAITGIREVERNAAETPAWNNVLGSGLFFRALNLYQLMQLFAPPYDRNTASMDLGVPIRLEPDLTLYSRRASVEEVYRRIVNDLEDAEQLLPDIPLVKYRPSKSAVYALLAKTYLLMGDYTQARAYADRCLAITGNLVDFNDVDASVSYPFAGEYEENPEIIFFCSMRNIQITATSRINIDTTLLAEYDDHDLRKSVYFGESSGRVIFKGSYRGSAVFFTGLATDEIYLIRAEAKARLGDRAGAMDDLNALRKHRYDKDHFVPIGNDDQIDVLQLVIEERRKELVLRGVRWEDLRRLNRVERFAKTLVREVDGVRYVLEPNSLRYVWPIPNSEVDLSGMQQNPR